MDLSNLLNCLVLTRSTHLPLSSSTPFFIDLPPFLPSSIFSPPSSSLYTYIVYILSYSLSMSLSPSLSSSFLLSSTLPPYLFIFPYLSLLSLLSASPLSPCLFIKHITTYMYLTVTTAAYCYRNFSFIHSFIHTEHLYSASSRELLRGAPDSSTAKKSSLKLRKKRR